VPGHNLAALQTTFRRAFELKGPVIVHVRTRKGRGYRPAETDQVGFHGAALPPMVVTRPATNGHANGNGTTAPPTLVSAAQPEPGSAMPTESMADDAAPPDVRPKKAPNYTAHFVRELVEVARTDERIVAITAGMPTGTGLNVFQAEFPERFFDVGICEPHAVTMATGLAMGGRRPVVAIYSTFLQRAFDSTVHDVCQNDQPVLLAVDRAGLVGEDGTSHQGMFTLPAQRQLPNLVIASPRDEQELRSLVRTAFSQDHPFALHYPRDPGFEVPVREPQVLPIGQGELLRDGQDVLLIGFGPIVHRASAAAVALAARGWSVAVINSRFAKPLDRQLILDNARGKRLVVTLEESVVSGGFGSAVLELLEDARLADPRFRETTLKILGLPADRFVDHGSVADLRAMLRLDDAGVLAQIEETLAALHLEPRAAEATVDH
jgi:1-deoxy-D-xylulose-5-phosphate synthase